LFSAGGSAWGMTPPRAQRAQKMKDIVLQSLGLIFAAIFVIFAVNMGSYLSETQALSGK
jgi:hypothetical protein